MKLFDSFSRESAKLHSCKGSWLTSWYPSSPVWYRWSYELSHATRQDVVRQFPTLPAQYHPWPGAWDWRDRARNLFLLFSFHGPRSSSKSLCLGDEVSVDMEELYHWKFLFVTLLSFLDLCFCWTTRARFLTLPSCFWHKKRLWITGSLVLGMIGSMMQMLAVLLCLTSLHLCLFTAWYSGFRVLFTRLENVHLQDIKFLRNATHLLMLFDGDPHALKMHARVPPGWQRSCFWDVPHEKTT